MMALDPDTRTAGDLPILLPLPGAPQTLRPLAGNARVPPQLGGLPAICCRVHLPHVALRARSTL